MAQVTELSAGARGATNTTEQYERCIAASKRVRWEIDEDVIRGRQFDRAHKYLPDSLSLVNELEFLDEADGRYLSQIQGRTYAYIFGLVERFINAKVLELSRKHWFGDQRALEALVRFSDEELKHQELFRRIEKMVADTLPGGYRPAGDPDDVARLVMSKSTWAVLALTCHIELFTQAHYRHSIEPDADLSALYKDVFLYHWKEESQHAIIDEIEWRQEHAQMTEAERDQAVDQFIELVCAVDGLLQAQAAADAEYFAGSCTADLSADQHKAVGALLLKAYRWQYIFSGAQDPRFLQVLGSLTTEQQLGRISSALEKLAG